MRTFAEHTIKHDSGSTFTPSLKSHGAVEYFKPLTEDAIEDTPSMTAADTIGKEKQDKEKTDADVSNMEPDGDQEQQKGKEPSQLVSGSHILKGFNAFLNEGDFSVPAAKLGFRSFKGKNQKFNYPEQVSYGGRMWTKLTGGRHWEGKSLTGIKYSDPYGNILKVINEDTSDDKNARRAARKADLDANDKRKIGPPSCPSCHKTLQWNESAKPARWTCKDCNKSWMFGAAALKEDAPNPIKCPKCGSTERVPNSAGGPGQAWKCGDCGHVFTSKNPFVKEARAPRTPDLARASGKDAADDQMKKAGRTKWNKDDYDLATSTYGKVRPADMDEGYIDDWGDVGGDAEHTCDCGREDGHDGRCGEDASNQVVRDGKTIWVCSNCILSSDKRLNEDTFNQFTFGKPAQSIDLPPIKKSKLYFCSVCDAKFYGNALTNGNIPGHYNNSAAGQRSWPFTNAHLSCEGSNKAPKKGLNEDVPFWKQHKQDDKDTKMANAAKQPYVVVRVPNTLTFNVVDQTGAGVMNAEPFKDRLQANRVAADLNRQAAQGVTGYQAILNTWRATRDIKEDAPGQTAGRTSPVTDAERDDSGDDSCNWCGEALDDGFWSDHAPYCSDECAKAMLAWGRKNGYDEEGLREGFVACTSKNSHGQQCEKANGHKTPHKAGSSHWDVFGKIVKEDLHEGYYRITYMDGRSEKTLSFEGTPADVRAKTKSIADKGREIVDVETVNAADYKEKDSAVSEGKIVNPPKQKKDKVYGGSTTRPQSIRMEKIIKAKRLSESFIYCPVCSKPVMSDDQEIGDVVVVADGRKHTLYHRACAMHANLKIREGVIKPFKASFMEDNTSPLFGPAHAALHKDDEKDAPKVKCSYCNTRPVDPKYTPYCSPECAIDAEND